MSVSFQTDHSISESSVPNQAIRVLLVYPNTREVALANLGFQQVYTLLNSIQGVECDRYALPTDWIPETEMLSQKDLRSMDMNRLPADFDIIAFSISFLVNFRFLKIFSLNVQHKFHNFCFIF